MATPKDHAKCGASNAHRWLNCTAAPNFEAQFPDGEASVYAAEGTLAHEVCEVTAQYNMGAINKRTFNARIKKLRERDLFQEEMITTADFYANFLWEKANAFPEKPYQAQEVRVDFSDYVPEGFGTCDSIIIGGGKLHITDYKHGKGVPVSAENNPQMRLYALGALAQYGMFYEIETVSMAIVQPRITEEVSEEEISAGELLAWGEQIKPIAYRAYTGEGAQFLEGPWCRFCKGKAVCRARADNMTALEDFAGIPIEGKLTPEEKERREDGMTAGEAFGPVLSDTEVGSLLYRAESLVHWYNDLKEYALSAILAGKEIPGWKCVEGRSTRAWGDQEAAFKTLIGSGFDEALLYERSPKSLAQVEKMLGKKAFAEICGGYVVKPPGKPTLAEEGDKRPPYSPAAADFGGAAQ